ncbi:MAG: hypothetical protein ACTS68_02035 [Candidatus Hodgkinia cicadicola]
MKAKFLTIAGTASNVTKTSFIAILCEIGRQAGLNVIPFEAQNMHGETVTHLTGAEVSAAQWYQAGDRPPNVYINPILVKPSVQSCYFSCEGA